MNRLNKHDNHFNIEENDYLLISRKGLIVIFNLSDVAKTIFMHITKIVINNRFIINKDEINEQYNLTYDEINNGINELLNSTLIVKFVCANKDTYMFNIEFCFINNHTKNKQNDKDKIVLYADAEISEKILNGMIIERVMI